MRNEKAWILAVFWLLTETVMCSLPAGAMVPVGDARAVSGDVQALPHGSSAWERIGVGYVIQPGDTLRTGPASRVSVLCVDESQIKLGENTLMVFKSAEPSSRLGYQPVTNTSGSAYGLEQGRAWIRNTKEDFRFELSTPAVTAAIRGTEFTVEVDPDGASTISLLQGDLPVFNDFGALDLAAGEMATARPGEAPRKQILVQPENAVQWVLYYPGTGILRAVSLAGLGISTAGPAIRAYDRGDLRAARELALDPARADVGQAAIVLGFLALREGRNEEALARFDNALKIAPEPRAVAGRCLVLYHRGASDQAHITYSAIPRTAQTPDTLALGGFFALMAGKPEQATALLHPDDLPMIQHAMQHVLREHREEHLECRLRNQASEYSTVTVAVRLLFNEALSGEPRMYAVVRDISDQVALRQADAVIERLKSATETRTDRALAAFLNVSAAAISNARKNERIPADWLIETGQRTGRSIDWLVSGLGPVLNRG